MNRKWWIIIATSVVLIAVGIVGWRSLAAGKVEAQAPQGETAVARRGAEGLDFLRKHPMPAPGHGAEAARTVTGSIQRTPQACKVCGALKDVHGCAAGSSSPRRSGRHTPRRPSARAAVRPAHAVRRGYLTGTSIPSSSHCFLVLHSRTGMREPVVSESKQ